MKAEHRHELKRNELLTLLEELPEWVSRHLQKIIYVSAAVVIAAAVTGWVWYRRNVEHKQMQLELTSLVESLATARINVLRGTSEGLDSSYLFLQIAENLDILASKAGERPLAALAMLKRGEALRAELLYRITEVSDEEARAQVLMARDSYEEAIEKAGADNSLRASAAFGLGICEEELGNFEKAREIYSNIASDEKLSGTVGAVEAARRLQLAGNYREKIVFRPPPEPNEPNRPAEEAPVEPNMPPAPTEPNAAAETVQTDAESPAGK